MKHKRAAKSRSSGEQYFDGIGVAAGIAIGPAHVVEPGAIEVPKFSIKAKHLKAERARQLVQKSRIGSSDIVLKVFTAAETGAAQAHADNPSLANEYIFDWLESQLGGAGRRI